MECSSSSSSSSGGGGGAKVCCCWTHKDGAGEVVADGVLQLGHATREPLRPDVVVGKLHRQVHACKCMRVCVQTWVIQKSE